jgi:hypothetical protein
MSASDQNTKIAKRSIPGQIPAHKSMGVAVTDSEQLLQIHNSSAVGKPVFQAAQ